MNFKSTELTGFFFEILFSLLCDKGYVGDVFLAIPTRRPVNVATEGSMQVAPMCASCVLPKRVGKVV